MLQYCPNSDFHWILVQHSSMVVFHFWPSQGCKAQGPLQQSPGQQEEPPALLLSPGWQDTVQRVPGQSWPWGTWGTFWGALARPGTSWHVLERPGTSWNILAPAGTAWGTLDHPGPSWTILELGQLHLTWKILCSNKMEWVALLALVPAILVKCHKNCHFHRNVIFGSLGNIPPGPILGAKCHRLRMPVGFATRSSQIRATHKSLFTHPLF